MPPNPPIHPAHPSNPHNPAQKQSYHYFFIESGKDTSDTYPPLIQINPTIHPAHPSNPHNPAQKSHQVNLVASGIYAADYFYGPARLRENNRRLP
jgi:hypothetical protein